MDSEFESMAYESDYQTIEDLTDFDDNEETVEAEYEASVNDIMSEHHLTHERNDVFKKYEVLGVEQIVQLMNESIADVISVIELPNNIIRILLNHFNWDKQRLLEQYFDGNREQLFSNAHVISPYNDMRLTAKKKRKETCNICYEELPSNKMTSISCGHQFCVYCWQQYLTNKIMSEGVCNAISCAQSGCDIIVDDMTITDIIQDSKVMAKYQHLITNSFVVSNRFLRWCPTPNCLNAIKVNFVDFIPIECNCGSIFCFLCGEKWHEPTRCNVLKSWNKKCLGESSEKIDCETANWILSYTKECPKCKAPIEKNGGCNHMTCRNVQCRYEFCWVCLSDWAKHGYQQSCNRYEESKETQTARARLQRYIHFWTRFQNHQQSLNLETKLTDEVNSKMDELQLRNMTWVEVQFLKNAANTLCKCRQTLMYTYPFAYYLSKSNQSQIFEDNQSDLESTVEGLSEQLEKDLSEVNDIKLFKTKVLDISKYCESRRQVLVHHVVEGYDNDWWEFSQLD